MDYLHVYIFCFDDDKDNFFCRNINRTFAINVLLTLKSIINFLNRFLFL